MKDKNKCNKDLDLSKIPPCSMVQNTFTLNGVNVSGQEGVKKVIDIFRLAKHEEAILANIEFLQNGKKLEMSVIDNKLCIEDNEIYTIPTL